MSVQRIGLGMAVVCLCLAMPAWSQDGVDDPAVPPAGADNGTATAPMDEPAGDGKTFKEKVGSAANAVKDKAGKLATATKEKAGEIAKQVNESENAKKVTAGILQPIYNLAGALSLPGFHWVAFMLIFAGVVSFAGQLVFGKLIMLSKAKFSLLEIINDAVCLVICLVALVMTTQAATENSDFTRTPAMVLSATFVGLILGVILMRRGVAQEVRAARGE